MSDWYYDQNGARRGPVAEAQLRELIRKGELSADTLVWNSTFGPDWKALRHTELTAAFGPDRPPPLPASRVPNGLAWTIALLPLAGGLADYLWPGKISMAAAALAYVAAYTVLALIDVQVIHRSGRRTEGLSGWLAILIPVYLYQRAKVLGQPQVFLGLWVLSLAGSMVIANPGIFSGDTYWGSGVPECNSSFATGQVKKIFGDIPSAKFIGLRGVEVRTPQEVSLDGSTRTCRASVLASNDQVYPVRYSIELRPDRQIYTRVYIAQ